MEKHYRHVLFDLDGTLYDSVKANLKSLLKMLEERKPGHQESLNTLLRFGGTPAVETLRELGFAGEEVGGLGLGWLSAGVFHVDGAVAEV